ncbi:MAG: hypothetical protein ACFFCM_05470 [Promethearchaeota archaeon]
MKEQTFYRLFFLGIIILSFIIWQFFYPFIKPYPKFEYVPPIIPEFPTPRDPRTWEEWLPSEFYIDPNYIYIGVLIGIVMLIIALIVYYRRKPEE